MRREQSGTFVFHFGVTDDAALMQPLVALHNRRKCQSFGRKGQMTISNVLTQMKVTGLEGRDGVLEAIRWRQGSGEEVRKPIQHLFFVHRSRSEHRLVVEIGRRIGREGLRTYRRRLQ